MTDAYTELQRAFTAMDDRFHGFRTVCRGLAQLLREDMAEYLGIPAGSVKFFKSAELDEMNANGVDEIPELFNDPFQTGELAGGGAYRIGLCFSVCPVGETKPVWYPIIPLRFTSKGDSFSLLIEKSNHSFDLGQNPRKNFRPISKWIVKRWNEVADKTFENFLAGKVSNEMGFHTLFPPRVRAKN